MNINSILESSISYQTLLYKIFNIHVFQTYNRLELKVTFLFLQYAKICLS